MGLKISAHHRQGPLSLLLFFFSPIPTKPSINLPEVEARRQTSPPTTTTTPYTSPRPPPNPHKTLCWLLSPLTLIYNPAGETDKGRFRVRNPATNNLIINNRESMDILGNYPQSQTKKIKKIFHSFE